MRYSPEQQLLHYTYPDTGICTKCGNDGIQYVIIHGTEYVGHVETQEDGAKYFYTETNKYEYPMCRCWKCGTRWYDEPAER